MRKQVREIKRFLNEMLKIEELDLEKLKIIFEITKSKKEFGDWVISQENPFHPFFEGNIVFLRWLRCPVTEIAYSKNFIEENLSREENIRKHGKVIFGIFENSKFNYEMEKEDWF